MQKWVLFLLWLLLFILSGVISPLISDSILGTYWPGEFIFQCPIFCLFILFMRFSRQEYWSGLPFPSPVDHILSELSTMTCLSWVAPHGMAHSFTDLDKAVWHPTPVLLPGKPHGRRSPVSCSPWGREESDTTEQLHFHFSLSCIGEGNGNPLQCSCLENPRDGGAWWAAVYGVAQSRTWLKRLSSSSSSGSCDQIG